MCAIIGFEKRSIPYILAQDCLNRTKDRGPDMTRFVETKGGWLGFHRLAIMGLRHMPLCTSTLTAAAFSSPFRRH